MARPTGEGRLVLRDALLDAPDRALPLRELVRLVPASREGARAVVRRMLNGGELERAGLQYSGGRGRPAVLYRPVTLCALHWR